jgi:Putative addiction module component
MAWMILKGLRVWREASVIPMHRGYPNRGSVAQVAGPDLPRTKQALTLPAEDRVLLASGLLASLDSETFDEAEVERLWSAETEGRAAQLESGDAELVTWEQLLSASTNLARRPQSV